MYKFKNIILICSDQHQRTMAGCYDNQIVKTPNIDSLAENGTVFKYAYTPNPICVPARASFATGRYGSNIGCIDNASPYCGQAKSFGHVLLKHGIPVTTIGKLHFRNSSDDTGFPDQRIPLHVRDGVGDLYGTIRRKDVIKPIVRNVVTNAKCGESSYSNYDRKVTEETLKYLDDVANETKPWFLYVGYTFPHFPYTCPEETWGLYDENILPFPISIKKGERCEHESCQDIRRFFGLEKEFSDEEVMRAVHAYYGMCTFLDHQIGMVLDRLHSTGLDKNTLIIYTSDHGEMLGNHGLWFKNCMFEESVGVPMIIKGPGIPVSVNETIVSLLDIYPTLLDGFGIELSDEEKSLPGKSILPIAEGLKYEPRLAISEFHANASITGGFMLRKGNFKLIYYVGYKPQLFNLNKDPHELVDISENPAYAYTLAEMIEELRRIMNPEAVNAKVKQQQMDRLNDHGGIAAILNGFDPIIFSPPPKV